MMHPGERPRPAEPVRVVIADDDEAFRWRVAHFLGRHGIVVLDQAPSLDDALVLTRDLMPDVLILSLDMPGVAGPETAGRLAEAARATRVLALSTSATPHALADAIEAGAGAYLLKRPGERGLAGLRVALALMAGRPSAAEEATSP